MRWNDEMNQKRFWTLLGTNLHFLSFQSEFLGGLEEESVEYILELIPFQCSVS